MFNFTYRKRAKPATLVLNDGLDLPQTIQAKHFDDMTGLFLRRFAKMYGRELLTDDDKARMRRQLERVFDAKDAVDPQEPKGGMYLRGADR